MGELPSGTVTFLFTDIEGSTRLLQQLGDQYTTLLSDHARLIREACAAYHGSEVSTQGDSFFVAFPSALDAIHAVVQSQRLLAAHPWPEGVSVRVRMGLHTGEAQISALNYVGLDVHRAARIAAAAHGGQVLLSNTTYDLVETELPAGLTLRDLGEHRLKDLRLPKHLYQLIIAGLPSEFPALKSLDRSPNNLPLQLTSFVGRAQELDEVKQLLAEGRFLTLTGPAGSGKTRLALQVASDLRERYPAGVFFVGLATVRDPKLVASAIAQALGIAEIAGRSVVESLKDYLRSKSMLLLLDNFEQVMGAAPLIADLLAACGQITLLVTSREALRLSGERVFRVPPLDGPDPAALPSLASLSRFAAVELFVQRAQAIKPDFRLTSEIAPAVADICHRLDGLPLAIELAAARIKLLSPQAILARLERRLDFLTGGARDLPARQQTLRDAIAWSYDLLDESEQALFRRLSVFVGGWTLEAAEAIAGDGSGRRPSLDQIGSLVDKSLLRYVEGAEGEPRFVLLEVLREFALEALARHGEQASLRERHARFFLALAEQGQASLERAGQADWIDRMEQEHDNLRAALEWSQATPGQEDLCWRLASALGLFWEARGYFSEGRERLSALLGAPAAAGRTVARASLLARAAELAYRQSDFSATATLAAESLSIWRDVGDQRGIASALLKLGNAATESGDYETAAGLLAEALTIWRELDDRHGTARALISSGWTALRSGNHPLAKARMEEALAISRALEDSRSMGFELSGLGEVALREGDYPRATRLLEESLALRRQLGNKWGVGVSLGTLGWVALRAGDWSRAKARLSESLEVRQEIGDKGGSAWCLERLAEVALAQSQPEKAVCLLAAASALRESIGSVIDPVDRREYENRRDALRAQVGEARFAARWNEGRGLSFEQAVAFALER
jgi:predicted ATPase/class 3 adenylate cyclase